MMHLAFVVLSLALGLSSGAKIGMDEKTEDTRQGELEARSQLPRGTFSALKSKF